MSELVNKTLSVKLSVEELRAENGVMLVDIITEQLGHRNFNVNLLSFVGYLENGFWNYLFSNSAWFVKHETRSVFELPPMFLQYHHNYGTLSLTGPSDAEEVLIMLDLSIGGPTFNTNVVALTIPVVAAVKQASNIIVSEENTTVDGIAWQDCKFEGNGTFVPMYNLKKEIVGFTLVEQ